jgi:transcriptional regulator with XRE-family HTH domain
MNKVDQHIGMRIRNRRVALHKSLSALEQVTGIAAATLEACEAGRQRVSACDMIKICEALGMRPLDIFRGYPYPDSPAELASVGIPLAARETPEDSPKPVG